MKMYHTSDRIPEDYKEEYERIKTKFRYEFEREKIFNKATYKSNEAYLEIKRAREFFDRFTREILKNDYGFLKEELKKEPLDYYRIWDIAFENLFKPLKYWKIVNRIYDDYVKEITDRRKYFLQQNLIKHERGRKSGVDGEERLYDSMKIIGDKIRILRNVTIQTDDLSVEHDMIIIAPTGIFTIEIKNYKSGATIDKTGLLTADRKTFNIANQARRHSYNLKRLLGYFNYPFEIYPIIVWANDHAKINSQFKYIPVCYCNTLEYEIFDKNKYKGNYSERDIEEIYKYIKQQSLPEKEYPLGIDIPKYVKSYLEFLVAISFWADVGNGEIGDEPPSGASLTVKGICDFMRFLERR